MGLGSAPPRDPPGARPHLGHVLGDDVEAALLLHDHPQQLHQVAVAELPAQGRGAQGRAAPSPVCPPLVSPCPPPSRTHVITDASARNACAVASFLMHLTATLFPR